MKRNLVIGLVCILAVGVSMNIRAQGRNPAKEKAPAENHKKEHKHEEKGHSHDQPPPHGGTVVKLGRHSFNLEFVRDRDASKFLVYVLDGHMEYVDVPEKNFELVAKIKGKEERLSFNRVGEPEKSSLFEATADWIKSTKKFDATIPEITLKGKAFANISFAFPKGSAKSR